MMIHKRKLFGFVSGGQGKRMHENKWQGSNFRMFLTERERVPNIDAELTYGAGMSFQCFILESY